MVELWRNGLFKETQCVLCSWDTENLAWSVFNFLKVGDHNFVIRITPKLKQEMHSSGMKYFSHMPRSKVWILLYSNGGQDFCLGQQE